MVFNQRTMLSLAVHGFAAKKESDLYNVIFISDTRDAIQRIIIGEMISSGRMDW